MAGEHLTAAFFLAALLVVAGFSAFVIWLVSRPPVRDYYEDEEEVASEEDGPRPGPGCS